MEGPLEPLIPAFDSPLEGLLFVPAAAEFQDEEVRRHPDSMGHDGQKVKKWKTDYILADGAIDLRLISFLILAVIAILLVIIIIEAVREEYELFSEKANFPRLSILIIGTIISLIVLSYVCYNIYIRRDDIRLYIFWFFVLYLIFLVIFFINLAVRIEETFEGRSHNGNGFIFIFLADLTLFGLLILSYYIEKVYAYVLLIPIIWNLFLTYHWLFSN